MPAEYKFQFSMACPHKFSIHEDGSTETCDGEIEVGVISYDSGSLPTRDDPGYGPEAEWELVAPCEECGLSDDEAHVHYVNKIENRILNELGDYEMGLADAAADRAYEDWKDRQFEERD